ncbi:MAG: FadR/GntR family transcriptional regulator [Chloroflexota bacterium]
MYRPLRNGRLYEQIVEQIEQQVIDGTLQAGDKLPPERQLAEKFGVSRTAVREAVKALRQRGLIDVHPGRGTFVTNHTSQALHRSLGLALRIGETDGVASLIELRDMLEPPIAAKAALRATPEQIQQLETLVAEMDKVLLVPEAFIAADFAFHMTLAEATQNVLIPTIMNSIVDLLQEQRQRIYKSGGGQIRAQRHHRVILQAVRERDEKGAYEAMSAHLRQVREDFEADDTTTV